MAQEAAFAAFSRRSQEVGESPGRFATLTLMFAWFGLRLYFLG